MHQVLVMTITYVAYKRAKFRNKNQLSVIFNSDNYLYLLYFLSIKKMCLNVYQFNSFLLH
jgi:hypothetical protein